MEQLHWKLKAAELGIAQSVVKSLKAGCSVIEEKTTADYLHCTKTPFIWKYFAAVDLVLGISEFLLCMCVF